MTSIQIQLNTPQEIKRFVHVVNQFPYNLDLVLGNYRVDAKSIMGIFSLQLNAPVSCEIQSDNCSDLLEALAPFVPR